MNSSYYYNLMQQIQSSKNIVIGKKETYEAYLEKLKSLKNTLEPLPSDFLRVENCYENGGYFASGETLSKGMLKDKANTLSEHIDSIVFFIRIVVNKINEYDYQIMKLNSDYSDAATNYQKALIESGSK